MAYDINGHLPKLIEGLMQDLKDINAAQCEMDLLIISKIIKEPSFHGNLKKSKEAKEQKQKEIIRDWFKKIDDIKIKGTL